MASERKGLKHFFFIFLEIRREPTCAPSVLIMFINMMLFKHTEPAPKCEEFMFPGQNEIQMAFIAIALACVPVMLLGKPFYIMATRKRQGRVSSNGLNYRKINMF